MKPYPPAPKPETMLPMEQKELLRSHASSHRISIPTARSDLLDLVTRGLLQASRQSKRSVYRPSPGLAQHLAACQA